VSSEIRVTLPADPEGSRAAALRVREMVERSSETDALACELAVAEATANVVRHAEAADDFTLVARVARGRFLAAVYHRHSGALPPRAEMPAADAESGRGLALIAACMERVVDVQVNGERRLLMARRLVAPLPLLASSSPPSFDQESSS
jgi:anti-sigma regulatory factor (Ser/Thr protein kinase)